MTGGKGVFCMSAQEDNATLTALHRGAAMGKVDVNRVAVLRSGSDYSVPYPGQSDSDCLVNNLQQGGLRVVGHQPLQRFEAPHRGHHRKLEPVEGRRARAVRASTSRGPRRARGSRPASAPR